MRDKGTRPIALVIAFNGLIWAVQALFFIFKHTDEDGTLEHQLLHRAGQVPSAFQSLMVANFAIAGLSLIVWRLERRIADLESDRDLQVQLKARAEPQAPTGAAR
jgi:hypothetical protein